MTLRIVTLLVYKLTGSLGAKDSLDHYVRITILGSSYKVE